MTEEDKIKMNNHLAMGFGIGYFHTLLDKKLISRDEHGKLLQLFNKKMQKIQRANQ